MSLLTELDAFFTDHRASGDLDAGVEGPVVWIACECGARMARQVGEDEPPPAELHAGGLASFPRAVHLT